MLLTDIVRLVSPMYTLGEQLHFTITARCPGRSSKFTGKRAFYQSGVCPIHRTELAEVCRRLPVHMRLTVLDFPASALTQLKTF